MRFEIDTTYKTLALKETCTVRALLIDLKDLNSNGALDNYRIENYSYSLCLEEDRDNNNSNKIETTL